MLKTDLADLVKREINPDRRQDSKLRLQNLNEEYATLWRAFDAARKNADRQQLLDLPAQSSSSPLTSRSGTPNTSTASVRGSNSYLRQDQQKQQQQHQQQSSDDYQARVSGSLNRSINQVDEYLQSGTAAMERLRNQGYSLKVNLFRLQFLLCRMRKRKC